ncbi:MAG TPA: arginine--tRNA ligase, partial [Thermoprotei archaeon]|nr:arginine--tRNA ligase [Thermoprotei archaeon]
IDSLYSSGVSALKVNLGNGLKVRIEHTSVNPNKAIHVGHARNMILGDALARILKATGYKVDILNYIDDTGVQVADVILGFKYLGYVVENDQLPFDQYCGDVVYVKANEAIENNPELQEKRKDILRKIEECDPEISRFAREISDKVLRRQLLTAWRLGVEYDYLVWESDIIRSKLKDMGMKYLSKSEYVKIPEEGKYRGCVVVEVSKIDEFKGESDEVLVRSDGTLTYLCKDIFFAMWKLGLLNVKLKFIKYINQLSGKTLYSTDMKNGVEMDIGGCDYSINVIGSEQRRPQSILKYVLSSIFGRSVYDRYIHYAYEAVVLSKETVEKYLGLEATKRIQRMSGRKGIFINVDPFLDMLKNETYKLVKSSNPDIDDEVAMDIAEKIAISALRYSLLSVDRDKIVVFDINKMLDIRGESGAYILYSYARAMSILRKASSSGNPPLNVNLMNEHDINLIDQLLKFRYTLYLSAKNLEPKILCKYLYDLAKIFNDFYEKNPVIKAEEPVRNNRLLLVQAFIDVMKYGAELLGLKLVERM